jgi:glycosyltransferase involved in cell wall biosynthesis
VPGDTDTRPAVAIAVPAFNEVEGIADFLREIDEVMTPVCGRLTFVVVDDASTDGTPAALEAVRGQLGARLDLHRASANRGHGPSVLAAYRRALELGPEYVLQVDGDGQFHGRDLRRVLVLLQDQAGAVCGVRRFRQDPWFRMVMTRLLRLYVRIAYGVRVRDPNCPLRGYEATVLADQLTAVPSASLVPNLYLTVIAARRGVALVEVDVSHRNRRGSSAAGTSWGRGRSPIPWRLVRFSVLALRESLRFRACLRAGQRLP